MEHTEHTGHRGHTGHTDHTLIDEHLRPHNHDKMITDSHQRQRIQHNQRTEARDPGGQPRGPDARFLLWATTVSKGSSVICVCPSARDVTVPEISRTCQNVRVPAPPGFFPQRISSPFVIRNNL
jgi:hypothetical protein